MQRRIVIAGTGSGAGKTTVAIGLMAALRRRGLRVQGFKCGPDYIDPTYHTAATGRTSRNLDSWMLSPEALRQIYARAAAEADIAVIEGVMGLYDGRGPHADEGSTAELAMLLDSPVALVVDCGGMARSAAAVVQGFLRFEPRTRIVAVIANRVGSESHFRLVKEAIERACGVPVIGGLRRDAAFEMPERHLGLVPAAERGDLLPMFDGLAAAMADACDLERLLRLAEAAPVRAGGTLFAPWTQPPRATIAVARDAAFHFYYAENLELLEASGAELVFFSPLAGEPLPSNADGLYIGGGFPEQFAARLTADERVKASIRAGIEAGLPTLAECGGFMYLTDAIEDAQGRTFPMVGAVPGRARMRTKLAALGYREIAGAPGNPLLPPGERARGHEFRYSVYEPDDRRPALPYAYDTTGTRGAMRDGALYRGLTAGYTHLHFASAPGLADRFVARCAQHRADRRGESATGGRSG